MEFNQGDIVEILKDHNNENLTECYHKKGEFAVVQCCGEELGGEENLRLICRNDDFERLKNFLNQF